YDPVGNVRKEISGTATTYYAFNAANELCWSGSSAGSSCGTAPSGSTTYAYDDAGNLTSSSGGFSANYSVMNQTASITPPGGSALAMSYADFTQDRRLTAGDLTFSYNQLGLADQATGGGQPHIARFIRDPNGTLVAMTHNDVDQTPNDLYYHFDGLGSVVATTDPSGNVVRRYTYEPYGKELSPSSTDYNPWRYASGYYDKTTKLLKFGTRYYDPEILRWTQRDPAPGKPDQPMTFNAYSYVGGNPVNFTDTSGRWYLDLSISVGPVTVGVAINEAPDGSVGGVHPYVGGGLSKAPASFSTSVGTGRVSSGMDCAQGQAASGVSGAGGYCWDEDGGGGAFGEAGTGTPQASASWIHYF
ncbi:MAG: RHS repeat-associated core domain-containing protein, partial [Actinomycetota bacterium]|nr:RHS repeat-associated core domain-containing protein [Actinomycetota bacterium]